MRSMWPTQPLGEGGGGGGASSQSSCAAMSSILESNGPIDSSAAPRQASNVESFVTGLLHHRLESFKLPEQVLQRRHHLLLMLGRPRSMF